MDERSQNDMNAPRIRREDMKILLDTRFLRVADLKYGADRHYYGVSRRGFNDLAAVKSDEEFKKMVPDAVTTFLIVNTKDAPSRLLLFYEYRYPTGRFLLSPPAGLIDPADRLEDDPIRICAKREILEETGIRVKDTDRLEVISPLVFSTPGLSDESNALACAVVELDDLSSLTQDGAQGSECFRGFRLYTKEEALAILRNGRDEYGHFYSAFTWMALTYFATDCWKK